MEGNYFQKRPRAPQTRAKGTEQAYFYTSLYITEYCKHTEGVVHVDTR